MGAIAQGLSPRSSHTENAHLAGPVPVVSYHFGASLKNLGRQYCAVSKMDTMFIPSIMKRI